MVALRVNFSRLPIEEQIDDILVWINVLRDKKRYFRRCRRKDIRVQAILNPTLKRAKALLGIKVR
jgi:hypothetical protein